MLLRIIVISVIYSTPCIPILSRRSPRLLLYCCWLIALRSKNKSSVRFCLRKSSFCFCSYVQHLLLLLELNFVIRYSTSLTTITLNLNMDTVINFYIFYHIFGGNSNNLYKHFKKGLKASPFLILCNIYTNYCG